MSLSFLRVSSGIHIHTYLRENSQTLPRAPPTPCTLSETTRLSEHAGTVQGVAVVVFLGKEKEKEPEQTNGMGGASANRARVTAL